MKKNSAFTVLELSIVLILIGILIAGVAKSGSLINASRLSAARSLTTKSTVPSISGLVAWYETSLPASLKTSEALDGKQITTWYDISPNSIAEQKNKLTRTASSTVTYQRSGINNIPSIKFHSTGVLTLSDFYQGTTAQSTIFIVSRMTSGTSGLLIDSGACGYGVCTFGFVPPDLYFNLGIEVSTGTVTNRGNVALGKNIIAVAYLNGSSSKAYQNNSGANNVSTMIGNAAVNAGTGTLRGLTVGADRCNSYNFIGLISEIIIYNRPLQIQERKDVMKYLSKKYGIATAGLE